MTKRALELLYDSEATLRLVDHELEELRGLTDEEPGLTSAPTAADVERAGEEIARLVEGLRECRAQVEGAAATGLRAPAEPASDAMDLVAVQLRLQAATAERLGVATSMLAELEARLAVVGRQLAARR